MTWRWRKRYCAVADQGGVDQASFSIGGVGSDELIIADGTLDFESQSTYTVVVRVTDSGGNDHDETITVSVDDLNELPTAITPNSFNVDENTDTSSGFSLGTLSTSDPDTGETFSYVIQGGVDQASFSIGGVGSDELIITDGTLDFESQSTYTVVVRVTDSGGNDHDETITVSVDDLNELPTAITPNSFNVDENTDTSSGFSLGTLSTSDPDTGETFSYVIQGGVDQASFSIGGVGSDELIITDGTLDFESQSTYTVVVRVTDSGGNDYDETITVSVDDLNELPTAITPNSFNVDENTDTSSGFSLGTLSTSDPDTGETFSYVIQGGVDQASFSIGGVGSDELIITDGILDFGSQSTYTVVVRVTDSGGNDHDETITVSVDDLNELPTAITPNSFNVDENTDTSSGFSLGTLSTSDPDTGETFSYVIQGGVDQASFSIGGVGSDELIITDGTLDFESQSTYTVVVRVTDSGGNDYDETITVSVDDLNELPTAITPNSFNVDENTDTSSGFSLGTLSTSDPDTGETFSYVIQGGVDQASFSIGGVGSDELIITDGILDFGSQSTYTVVVRVTDSGGNDYDETITVSVNDLNGAPTAITPNALNVDENTDTSSGFSLGTLSTSDPDTGETFSYVIQGGVDQASFSIGGVGSDELIITDGTLDFESQSTYTVVVRVTDGGGNDYDETITVNVNDLVENAAPTNIQPDSFSIDENIDTSSGHQVGTLTTTDPTIGETFTYSILAGGDGALFSIGGVNGDRLVLQHGVLDFESLDHYTVNVQVIDSGGNAYSESLVVNVNDLNEAPAISLSSTSQLIAEDADLGTGVSVANIMVTDDALGTNTLSLSGADANWFELQGAQLVLKPDAPLDYEADEQWVVVVNVTDLGLSTGPMASQSFTLDVQDVNETPIAAVDEYAASGALTVAAPGILANDLDPDGDSLSIFLVTPPANGVLTLNTDGSFMYVPNPGFFGDDTFVYRVDDANGQSSIGSVNLFVQPPGPVTSATAPARSTDSADEQTTDDIEITPQAVTVTRGSSSRTVYIPNIGRQSSSAETSVAETLTAIGTGNQTQSSLTSGGMYSVAMAMDSRVEIEPLAQADRSTIAPGSQVFSVYQMFGNALEELQEETHGHDVFSHAVVSGAVALSSGLSVGYVIWIIRGGVLLSSFLSSMPAWRLIDPLPVLGFMDDDEIEGDDDSLESLVAKSNERRTASVVVE